MADALEFLLAGLGGGARGFSRRKREIELINLDRKEKEEAQKIQDRNLVLQYGAQLGITNPDVLERAIQMSMGGDFAGAIGEMQPPPSPTLGETAKASDVFGAVKGGTMSPEAGEAALRGEGFDFQEAPTEATKPTSAKDRADLFLKFQDQSEQFSKSFQTVKDNLLNIEASTDRILGTPEKERSEIRGPAEQAIVISFNKILDPTSVVRESEFERVPENIAVVDRARAKMRRLSQSGLNLPDSEIQEIREVAREMARIRQDILNKKLQKQLRRPAARFGLNPDEVAPLFNIIPESEDNDVGGTPEFEAILKNRGY